MGAPVPGVVNLVMRDEQGWVRVGGSLDDGAKGSFSLSQKGGQWAGSVRHAAKQTAYVLDTQESGVVRVVEKPLGSLLCQAIPRKRAPNGVQAAASGPSVQDASVAAVNTIAVPALDSLPSATHVIYIDFDGELVTDPDWNDGFSILAVPTKLGTSTITAAQMTEVWKRVAEDMRPFNVSVTTIASRYENASVGERMRCIVTSTDAAAPGAGGVAYLDTFNDAGPGSGYTSTVPCWAFTESYYLPDDIAGTISHEVGHTFGLSHDGRFPDNAPNHEEYYDGHGSGATSWAPLMGSTYDHAVSQWSRGEYANASNHEDDLAIIGNAANGFFLRPDDALDSPAGAMGLPNTGFFSQSGIVSAASDIDFYTFVTPGGNLSLTASSAAVGPNLDILLELRSADGSTVLANSNPVGPAKALITKVLAPGTYLIAVRGSGFGNASAGYTTYGSIGEYTLGGTFPAVPDVEPVIDADPFSQAVPPGTKVTFTVAATSNTPPTYQWTKDDVNLPGQTKNTLVINSAQVANQGAYRCIVSNTIGSTPSAIALLTVNYKPVFTLHPVARKAAAGTAVSFNVAAHGTPLMAFQWQLNGIDIPAATTDTLTIASAQWADLGSYRCVASNAFGSAISKAATLTVESKPVILTQPPVNFLAPLNGATTVGLIAAGTGKLSYQWFKGAALLPGQTKPALSLTGITGGTAGDYLCEVKNSFGTTTSDVCHVAVQDVPVITRDLTDTIVARGAKKTLSVAAVGSPVLKYEWRKNGVKVPGAAASLVVVGTADAEYQVLVSNALNVAASAVAHVTVHDVPKIIIKPVALIKPFGGEASFSVAASGTPPLVMQWKKNNVAIPGATDSVLELAGLAASDVASYSVTISNDAGSVTSTPVKLTLQTGPSVTVQPEPVTVNAFAPAAFGVTATGTATLKYQWQKDNVDIPGATAAVYKIASAQTSMNGMYRVRVSNAADFVFSDPAELIVNPVLAPSLTSFSPPLGKAGHYVRIVGANLNWTTGVSFRSSSNVAVPAAFVIVSSTELLVTVPAKASSSAITVTTRGGTVATGTFFAVTTVNDTNDDFANARLMPGGGGRVFGSNYQFSPQSGEPRHAMPDGVQDPSDFDAVFSAWVEWTPTVSGSYYVNTGGSVFDTRVAIYEGDAVNNLTLVGFNDDDDGAGLYTSKAYVVVNAGTTYHIAVDGFSLFFFGELYEQRGNYTVTVTPIAASAMLASSQKSGWSTQGTVAVQADGAVKLGGSGSHEPAMAWLKTPASTEQGKVLHVRATVSFDAPRNSGDVFGIVACNQAGQPMFGLSANAGTGSLSTIDAAGVLSATGQTLVVGESYEADLYADPVKRTWSASLNGVWIAREQPFPAQGDAEDFAVQWLPGSGAHGSVTVHSAEYSGDQR